MVLRCDDRYGGRRVALPGVIIICSKWMTMDDFLPMRHI